MTTHKPHQNPAGYTDLTAFNAINNAARASRIKTATEAQEQAAVFEWARLQERKYPDLWFLHHIPNGGSRNKAEAASLKRQGVKPGVSDISLPVPRGDYHGLYIELKAKSGRISDHQAKWVNRVRKNGYAAFICYGAGEAIETLTWYLSG